nr:gamma-glutamylcyclotransferase [Pseudomonas cavernae]
MAYRLPSKDHRGQLDLLMRREIDANPPTNIPRWIKIQTDSGPLLALAFVADRNGRAYAGKLPLPEVAHILAHAAGHWGRLHNTCCEPSPCFSSTEFMIAICGASNPSSQTRSGAPSQCAAD